MNICLEVGWRLTMSSLVHNAIYMHRRLCPDSTFFVFVIHLLGPPLVHTGGRPELIPPWVNCIGVCVNVA